MLRNPDTRYGCLDRPGRTTAIVAGLGIECFELAGTTLHPQDNHRHAFFLKVFSPQSNEVTQAERAGCGDTSARSAQESPAAQARKSAGLFVWIMSGVHFHRFTFR
jgi:hypothetical protein